MSECRLLSPLRRDGTSQRQRMPRALESSYVKVDERGTGDLLLYATRLAPLLRYYSLANEPAGNWTEFIERDVSTLAARIGDADLEPFKSEFDAARETAADDATNTEAERRTALAALFPPIFAIASLVESWRRLAVEGLLLQVRIDRLIEGVMADALHDAIAAAKQGQTLGATITIPDMSGYGDVWGDPAAALADPSVALADPGWGGTIELVARAFDRVYEAAKRLGEQAPEFLVDSMTQYPEHRPHMALFLAFLRLLNYAKRTLNGITDRHLDYFYRDVLQLVPRPAVADRVHVLFELAKSVSAFKVSGDTLLNAGKDATGVPLVYGTDAEIVVNKATLDQTHGLKTVFVDMDDTGIVRNIHAAPDADSADGLGEPLDDDDLKWPVLGSTAMPDARIGFALASPMLWLAEGTRIVTVRFTLDPAVDILCGRPEAVVERELARNVTFEASGAKGWIAITGIAVSVSAASGNRFVEFTLTIPASEPAIVVVSAKLHAETFATDQPVLRVILDNRGLPGELFESGPVTVTDYSALVETYHAGDLVRYDDVVYQAVENIEDAGYTPSDHPARWAAIEYAFPYKYFEAMSIQSVTLGVNVSGMRSLVLENDLGVLNPAKPFLPFGPAPTRGAHFLVGSWEAFQKPLSSLTLGLTWAALPTVAFVTHYGAYPSVKTLVAGNAAAQLSFTADAHVLLDRDWDDAHPVLDGTALFATASNVPQPDRTITIPFSAGSVERDPELDRFTRLSPSLGRGFIRLTLNQTFLHEQFAGALTTYAASLPTNASAPLPNAPYTPAIASLTLSYAATQTIDYATMTADEAEDRFERLFQIGPFGQREVLPASDGVTVDDAVTDRTPVPRFTYQGSDGDTAEGTLYLGLSGLVPPQNLSMLFQMAEGSEDPDLPAQDLTWSYLTASGWVDFAVAELTGDTTDGLIASGIVQYAVPREATSAATLLPAGLHWLRATVRRDSAAVPKAIGVHPQAVQASFRDHGNDPDHAAAPLAAGTIAKLLTRDASIKTASQLYSSFAGQVAEGDRAFRLRAAERLRHKRRAISIFDYERLVLEKFPEVYKVRCLCHTSAGSEYAPGSVRVVVVPNLRNRNAVDPLRPRLALSRLESIREYLAGLASDFADIAVVNPDYEAVRARFNVRFRAGYDKGYYTTQLEQDIVTFLSPWLYDEAEDLTFGGRVHRSSILNFIDEREYVDFVTDFEMDHIVGDETRTHVEEAEATRSSAVIVPAKTHEIGDEIVSCDDEDEAADDDATPGGTSPGSTMPAGAARYLGNVVERELHDRLNLTPNCNIGLIAIDRRFPFRRIEDAQALGYDVCAYCFGRDRSTR